MRLVSNLPRALGAVAALAALAVSANAQTIGCEVGVANGGLIPATGTGGGTYPGTLPTAPSLFTLNVASLPPGATVVTEVKLFGAVHTWLSDVQFVLQDPSGGLHNVFVRGGTATGTGYSCDFGGDYTFVPACTTAVLALPASCTGVAVLAPGTYDQYFGRAGLAWPNGTNGINNTPLDSIPAATGIWTLRAYDWASGDTGSLGSFDVCFGTPATPTAPSAAPTLSAPANGATALNPVTLTWTAVNCATSYDVDVDGVITNVPGTTTVLAPQTPGIHTWTVRGVNAGGNGPFAAPFTFDVPPPPPASVCVPNGAGAGPVPALGTGGGGVWPGTLPPTPYTNTYNVTLPPGATQIIKLDLTFSTQHTWAGDLFVVLTDPTGGNHNIIHRIGSTGSGAGLNCDLNGAYSIYETAGAAWPTICPGTTDIPVGDYDQFVGGWPSGTNGIFNTPLSAIPVSNGAWTLTIYDWAGGDSGALGDWQLCFDTGPVGPVTYCTAGTTTNGCAASLSATGNPSVTQASPCVISSNGGEGSMSGVLFYGVDNSAFTPVPWGATSSFRCVKNPVQRMGLLTPVGTPTVCDGDYTFDWDAWQLAHPLALGNPWSAGDTVYVQAWFRDVGVPKGSTSNALELTYDL